MNREINPLSAATHPAPYGCYATLAAEKPFYWDDELEMWVASSADAVRATLSSDICSVRPVDEPAPEAIAGSPAGDVFARLVRMNDGPYHRSAKSAISDALEMLDISSLAERSARFTRVILAADDTLPPLAYALPVFSIADQLGVPEDRLADVAHWTVDFIRCLSPLSSPEQLERSKDAAQQLRTLFHRYLDEIPNAARGSLFGALALEMQRCDTIGADAIAANAIGFLSQACEATAGLIGNTLVALEEFPGERYKIGEDSYTLDRIILEVLRFDPPIQNTRRFVVSDGMLTGRRVSRGDAILVLLAAANRDPALNPDPERFDYTRPKIRHFTLGYGRHACPGGDPATVIASACVRTLLELDALPSLNRSEIAYHPSINARIPIIPGITAGTDGRSRTETISTRGDRL
jgi:cytochrome P450